jgi:hypothetical protein
MIAIEASRMRWYSLVGERHRRRHGDRVAGVDAHRIEVLDRADDDALSLVSRTTSSSYSFQPSDALLEQHLVDRRHVERELHHPVELAGVVGDAAARAAQRERRPRITHGRPMSSRALRASSIEVPPSRCGQARPIAPSPA